MHIFNYCDSDVTHKTCYIVISHTREARCCSFISTYSTIGWIAYISSTSRQRYFTLVYVRLTVRLTNSHREEWSHVWKFRMDISVEQTLKTFASAPEHCTYTHTITLSLTPEGAVFARLTPMPSLSGALTLGLETGMFRWRVRKYGTVSPPHCDSLTLNSGSSNDF